MKEGLDAVIADLKVNHPRSEAHTERRIRLHCCPTYGESKLMAAVQDVGRARNTSSTGWRPESRARDDQPLSWRSFAAPTVSPSRATCS